jgi:hypothetical protein
VAVVEHERLGDVAGVEPARRRHVSGQGELRAGGERGVGAAADAGLEHPAAPHRHAAGRRDRRDLARLEVAADAAGLDVDDLAGTERDRVRGRPRRRHRLVEADRCRDPLRQLGMAAQVVLGERLLDQQQVERVELGQPSCVAQGVGGVRVDLQEQVVAEALPHRAHRLDVPAGLDLQLDPDVALVEVAADDVEQLRNRVHDPDGDTGWHAVTHRAEERRERLPRRAQLRVEQRHLDGGLRHRVALDRLEDVRDLPRRDVPGGEQPGEQEPAYDVLRGVDVLVGVQRRVHGDALAPAVAVRSERADQQRLLRRLGPERRPERRDQRQRDAAQLDGGQLHGVTVAPPRAAFVMRDDEAGGAGWCPPTMPDDHPRATLERAAIGRISRGGRRIEEA